MDPIRAGVKYTAPTKENNPQNNNLITFSTQATFNNQTYTVSIHYHKDSNVSEHTAKSDLEKQIDALVKLADKLELGQANKMQKIELSQNEVKAFYKNEKIVDKFEDKLREKLTRAKDDQEVNLGKGDPAKKLEKITEQLELIQTIKTNFTPHSYASSISRDTSSNPQVFIQEKTAQLLQQANVIQPALGNNALQINNNVPATFAKNLAEANKQLAEMKNIEKTKYKSELANVIDGYQALDNEDVNLKVLKQGFRQNSLEIKKEFDKSQQDAFKKLESALVGMTTDYNSLIEQRTDLKQALTEKNADKTKIQKELKELESQISGMKKNIDEVNREMGHRALPTNSLGETKSKITDFAAVFERKLELREQKAALQSEISKLGNKARSYSYDDPKFILEAQIAKIDTELLKAPPFAHMKFQGEAYLSKLDTEASRIVTPSQAREANKPNPDLAWGASHVLKALTLPSNWTEISNASIKLSGSGRAYVSSTVNSPLNISLEGGVPAGLRENKDYRHRPTNLIMAETTLRGGLTGDAVLHSDLSFRGGQFPTKEAAKEAILTMVSAAKAKGITIEDMHINALLTPVVSVGGWPKKDIELLKTHKENVNAALAELVGDTKIAPDTADQLKTVQKRIAISNFGVNEGATGALTYLTHKVRTGHHESVKNYSNEASQKLNESVNKKLAAIDLKSDKKELLHDLDRLGAIVQVGQEVEAIWANNDYANGHVGNNQFKMASNWMVLDGLLGVTCYVDCMSGKDRTGLVVSSAQFQSDEIQMNIHDQKIALHKSASKISSGMKQEPQQIWNSQADWLTCACFTEKDLTTLAQELKMGFAGNPGQLTQKQFEDRVQFKLNEKIASAKSALGGDQGLMARKEVSGIRHFVSGTYGISKNAPKLSTLAAERSKFPEVIATSAYAVGAKDTLSMISNNSSEAQSIQILNRQEEIQRLEKRQQEAKNRKLSQLSGSLQVTKVSTNFSGFKMDVGEPLEVFSAGFYRPYVLNQLLDHYLVRGNFPQKETQVKVDTVFMDKFSEMTGLDEFDKTTQKRFQGQILKVLQENGEPNGAIKQWTKILKEIENEKMLTPKAKVKS